MTPTGIIVAQRKCKMGGTDARPTSTPNEGPHTCSGLAGCDGLHIALAHDVASHADWFPLPPEKCCAQSSFDPRRLRAPLSCPPGTIVALYGEYRYDPLEVLRDIRAANLNYVCVLVANSFVQPKVDELFRAGGDDYMITPLHPHDLVMRLRVLQARRAAVPAPDVDVVVGPLRVDPFQRIFVKGFPCGLPDLPKKELQVFRYLARHAGQVVRHEQLRSIGWCSTRPLGSNSLEVHVSRIRRWLREVLPDGDLEISSVRGVGYQLTLSAEATPPMASIG